MSESSRWLDRVLAEQSHLGLDCSAGRDILIKAILEALPREQMAIAIATATHTVLSHRAIRDASGDIARQIAATGITAVMAALEATP